MTGQQDAGGDEDEGKSGAGRPAPSAHETRETPK